MVLTSSLFMAILPVLITFGLIPGIRCLQVTAGSPCSNVCQAVTAENTTGSQIVCLDGQYSSTTVGKTFHDCITCELNSAYTNQQTGESDVLWGLYNLRYAFSACVYSYPVSVTNVSTPCLVSCTPLSSSLEYGLLSPSRNALSAYCGISSFADNLVTQCEYCYSLTTSQAYLANFLEAIRYNCHFQTATGTAFAIQPSTIFNSTLLPASTASISPTSAASGSSVIKNLGLLIALPIAAFAILLCFSSVCCFFLIRHRRRKAKKRRQALNLHARWNETMVTTPGGASWAEFPLHQASFGQGSAYGPGFEFVDQDGRRQDVGYSTGGFASHTSPISPPLSVPSHAFYPEPENPGIHEQPYFPPPPTTKP